MELVFENGQIIAKGQRSNVFSSQNRRTISIMDLYEAEYNEDFKKSIHGGSGADSGVSIKNLVETQVVPDHHLVAVKASSSKTMIATCENRNNIEFIPPDEQSVVAERSIESGFDSYFSTDDTEGSKYLLSSSQDDDSDDARQRRTRKYLEKRKQSTEGYSSSEGTQTRMEINKRFRALQDLLPNPPMGETMLDEAALDEAISYLKNLQNQVQMMTMGNRFVAPLPPVMLPWDPYYSQMGLPMGMGCAPQFLNHPWLRPMHTSWLYTPMENYAPQSVPPSCAAPPDQRSNSTSAPNPDDATTDSRSQGTGTDGEILSGKKPENP
ncbi:unnamed protein product [Arabis nemorensis]|uniref:BHLH domain-containing protein n=1 Tax=Arabis nemorensis TaxID=586526 RepID=A0A565BYU5_9BRAS|nr:unnamed protein product [Arabis nemorensis]